MECAITREKRIKKWNRAWKMKLIEGAIPTGATSPKTRFRSARLIVFEGWVPAFAGMTKRGWVPAFAGTASLKRLLSSHPPPPRCSG